MLDIPKPEGAPGVAGGARNKDLSAVRQGWSSAARRRFLLGTILLAFLAAGGATAWVWLFRPVTVQVSRTEHDVSVQVFGLGTVEVRVTSKVGLRETHWHVGMNRNPDAFVAPGLDEPMHTVVRAVVSTTAQFLEQTLGRAAFVAISNA